MWCLAKVTEIESILTVINDIADCDQPARTERGGSRPL